MTVARARKIQRFLSQPFAVAEVFTGTPGESSLPSWCCGGVGGCVRREGKARGGGGGRVMGAWVPSWWLLWPCRT